MLAQMYALDRRHLTKTEIINYNISDV